MESVCQRFVSAYGRDWAPDEQQLQEVRAHVRSRLNDRGSHGDGSRPGSSLVVVEGCEVGHPAALLDLVLRAARLYVAADDVEGGKRALAALQIAVRSRHNIYVLQQSFGLFSFLTEALSRVWEGEGSLESRQGMSREEVTRRLQVNSGIAAALLGLAKALLSVLSSERHLGRNSVILPETASAAFAEQTRASERADREMLMRLQHLLRGPVSRILQQIRDSTEEKEVQLQCLDVLCLLWPGPKALQQVSPSRSVANLEQACSESGGEAVLVGDASSVAALIASFIQGPSSRQRSGALLGLKDDLCSGADQAPAFQVQVWALTALGGLPDGPLPEDFHGRIAKLLLWAVDLESSSGAGHDECDAQGTMVQAVIWGMQCWTTHAPQNPFGGHQAVPGGAWDLGRLRIVVGTCQDVIECYEGEGDGIVLTCHALLTLVMAALGSAFLGHGHASKDGVPPGVQLVQLLRGEEETHHETMRGGSLWATCFRKVQRNKGVLRHMVLALEAAASVPALENCSPEMSLLVRLLERPHPIADAACAALSRLLRRAPRTASAAAVCVGLCGALCALLRVIQDVIRDNGVEARLTLRIKEQPEASGADNSTVPSCAVNVELDLGLSQPLRTQAEALGTLRTLFEASQVTQRLALGNAAITSILCSVVESGNRTARSAATDLLLCLLTVSRSSTEDDAGRKVLCTKLLGGWRRTMRLC